jgi:hypothetical protein
VVAEPTEDESRAQFGGWLGANPYYLMIILPPNDERPDQSVAEIDLDQRGWTTQYADFLRAVGQWYLVRKSGSIVVATMLVQFGEQPYYVGRHIGFAGGQGGETIAYGIGKKRLDGHVDRIWVMANGCVTLGDDVESISIDLLRSGML